MMIKKLPVKKIGMTSAFDGAGTTVPVTLVQPFDVVVLAVKRQETHGYSAVKCAYGETHEKKLNKPHKGELTKAGVEKSLRHFYESRVEASDLEGITLGAEIDPREMLGSWGHVKVTAACKGKGFAGAMKRWNFKGQCRTHGDPDNRKPQSNNATDPARVFKGSKRPGRMGTSRITIPHATVFEYDPELNLLALTGSVPGPNGGTAFLTLISEREPAVVEES
jgi:large subunit ribosomal protein L3